MNVPNDLKHIAEWLKYRYPILYNRYVSAYAHDTQGNAYNKELEVIVSMKDIDWNVTTIKHNER